MSAFFSLLDRGIEILARAVRWLALAMVLATLAVVVMRYVFTVGAIPLQEAVMYMHGVLFLLGIPYGLRQGTHVRVDIFYARHLRRWQAHIDLIGHILFLLPLGAFITITSWPYAEASWHVLEGSPEVGGIPAVFLLKSLLPLFGLLLISQGLVQISQTWQAVKTN